MKVHGKTIIVTGAGSGIGRELTLQLLAKGATVIGVDVNPSTLKETESLSKNGRLRTYTADISNRKLAQDLCLRIINDYKTVDGLINNAGIIQPFVKVNDLDYTQIERVFGVNLFGPIYLTKALLPHLLTRPEAHIANVSSMGGFLPVPGQTIYGASKAAIKLLTEGLHSELKDTNVRVTTIFPGAIATNITTNSGVTIPGNGQSTGRAAKTLEASKAAEIIIDAIERNQYRVLVGSDAKFMDKIYRFNPKYAAGFIANKMKDLLK